jgi:simple sugar transport system ATP-binding protein/ribose transport system ATP-binding protein
VEGQRLHIEAQGVVKRYGGAEALKSVSLGVLAGEVHGLVGENGAGKSTLGKIIAGAVSADAGVIRINGRLVNYRSPQDALRDGVTMMAQELAVVPQRSVIDNVFLGRRDYGFFVRPRLLARRYRELSDFIGYHLPPHARVSTFPVAEQQKVEILRAVARGAHAIVMDEPTAALARPEAEKLFDVIRRLRDGGTTIIYVSHFLQDVLDLCDRITVLKDGAVVRTSDARTETTESLIEGMLGRPLDRIFPPKRKDETEQRPVLQVYKREFASGRQSTRRSFLEVKAGEIVGLAGLVGAGRSELARSIFGADRSSDISVVVDGKTLRRLSPRNAIGHGVVMVPESRRTQGLLMQRPVLENLSLASLRASSVLGFIRAGREAARCRAMVADLNIKLHGLDAPVAALSGGNQQKVLFGRWLLTRPKVLIADEPTRGIDIGAKQGIYELIHQLAAEGVAVLLISSEAEELIGLAHRVLVMRGGEIVSEIRGLDISESSIVRAAFGNLTDAGAAPNLEGSFTKAGAVTNHEGFTSP